MEEQKLKEVFTWVQTQIKKNPYSEISLKFSVHNGEVKRLERGLTEKIMSGGLCE